MTFQSTHPLRGATYDDGTKELKRIFQSTHPLRGATISKMLIYDASNISIHAPLAGCDQSCLPTGENQPRFQSTHPLRGATGWKIILWSCRTISIHAPLAGCDRCSRMMARSSFLISIHAPLAGCDGQSQSGRHRLPDFNPRTPCGVRLLPRYKEPTGYLDFNPRTPCGVRRPAKWKWDTRSIFQSTHPLRGATENWDQYVMEDPISIHAPLAGCD